GYQVPGTVVLYSSTSRCLVHRVHMSCDEADVQFLRGVMGGDFGAVKAALEAGAMVNGPPRLPHSPMMAALLANDANMVDFLLEQGADPERPVREEKPFPAWSKAGNTRLGERALHVAARMNNVEMVRLLLKRDRANVNATDNKGYTPLLATCSWQYVCMGVVRALLAAGADAAWADEDGCTPLHLVALSENMELVDMLHSRAPSTLNSRNTEDRTPLFFACFHGNEILVSKLLSLGAMQPTPFDKISCPLGLAVMLDSVGVARVLINEGGIRAVGGKEALTSALEHAVTDRRARMLRLLLAVDGRERRSEWANVEDGYLLHFGSAYCHPAAVSILLEAGGDEAAPDSAGLVPLEVLAQGVTEEDDLQMVPGRIIAIRRMLQRGPAYRARSWAWPSDAEEADDADGSGGGD
ncbi:unnamed protein product, partial [Laminaria digitata]